MRAIDPDELPTTAIEGRLCADVLAAWLAIDRGQPGVDRLVQELNNTLATHPIVSSRMKVFTLELVRLYERLDQDEAALRVASSWYYSWASSPYLLSPFLIAEADLAERLGDLDRARQAKRHLQVLREMRQ